MSEPMYVDQSFLVTSKYSTEEAFSKLKKNFSTLAPRASSSFRNAFTRLNADDIKTTVEYAPIYHIFTKGELTWSETSYQNIGNKYTGNLMVEIDNIKKSSESIDAIIDKSKTNSFSSLALGSYQNDEGKIFHPIENEDAYSAPLLYPLLTTQQAAKEFAKQAPQYGEFTISNMDVTLVLVPVACFHFEFCDIIYRFYVNLYSGRTDVSDVDTSPEIEKAYQTCEKIHKVSKITKIAVIAAYILDLVIIIFKGVTNNISIASDLPSMIMFWIMFAALPALLIFVPMKKQDETWSYLKKNYPHSDHYIADNGRLRFKTILFLILNIVQIVIPAGFAMFVSMFAILL